MDIQKQVCTIEQAKKLKELGIEQESLFYYRETFNGPALSFNENDIDLLTGMLEPDTLVENDEEMTWSAFTAAELLKMLPFRIHHDGQDHFLAMGHSSKGYRIIYETNKLGLVVNDDMCLDREKKALFETFRSGRNIVEVMAEYLRMLIEHGDGVVLVEQINERILNA